MPTQEPQHYWPFDQFQPEPAREVQDEAPAEKQEGQSVVPFQMTGGETRGRDFAFEMTFFEVNSDGLPKESKAPTTEQVNPTVTNKSLGE